LIIITPSQRSPARHSSLSLENAPKQESKSRVKGLKGLRQPQYRLRVDRLRVFYDVNDEQGRVEVLGFVMKPEAENWLKEHGVPE
jgi:mRNA-degrading endonuclease RelE of RelBE toxin-antitoxin system